MPAPTKTTVATENPTDEDSELLEGIARRDSTALEIAHDRFARPLYSVAYRMLRSHHECEEVVQDVLVTLWKKGHTVDLGKGKLFSWLAAVLRNRCIDRVRASGRRIPSPPPTSEGRDLAEPVTSETAADLAYSKEKAARLKSTLETLPEDQRVALELAFFSGMSHSEIAEHLDETLGTVKSRIRYGLTKMRSALAGKEVSDG